MTLWTASPNTTNELFQPPDMLFETVGVACHGLGRTVLLKMKTDILV